VVNLLYNNTMKYKSFTTISIRFNNEEQEIVRKLKDEHGVNICGMIKVLLKKKLKQLEQLEKSYDINL